MVGGTEYKDVHKWFVPGKVTNAFGGVCISCALYMTLKSLARVESHFSDWLLAPLWYRYSTSRLHEYWKMKMFWSETEGAIKYRLAPALTASPPGVIEKLLCSRCGLYVRSGLVIQTGWCVKGIFRLCLDHRNNSTF